MKSPTAEDFFDKNYPLLRDGRQPFPWMRQLFIRLQDGKPPLQADLPTGSGKTDFVVVWLIALAFYGLNRGTVCPVPRRMAWVVNRRVLIGQIYELVKKLRHLLTQDGGAPEILQGLSNLCPGTDALDPLKIVQLRGQILADREWSFSPASPALIVGSVDQIGSRLLFQGYGLGKRERPMQGGLLGVDTWICVDEAHLVPAFIMTLRQLCGRIQTPPRVDGTIARLFDRLPWHLTELSATGALPAPPVTNVLSLTNVDQENPSIAMRIAAAAAKRVNPVACDDREIPEKIAKEALLLLNQRRRVAIYVTTPTTANKIKKLIEDGLPKRPKGSPGTDRVLTITGRMRGVERDQLHHNPVFQALSTSSRIPGTATAPPGVPEQTVYLIGTSAAEVGVDTDADVIFCDFAPLDTLLQRLGRLDRLGYLTADGQTPIMHIFGHPRSNKLHEQAARSVVGKLQSEAYAPGASLLAASAWSSHEKADEINLEATRLILLAESDPSKWRDHELAPAAISPILCQPLTDAVLQHWTATTPRPDPRMPVHPWLYGITQDDNATPLVGIIFRMEMDSLHGRRHEVEDPEQQSDFDKQVERVLQIFSRYSPARNEAHWLPLRLVRDWLNGAIDDKKETIPLPPLLAWIQDSEWRLSGAIAPEHEGDLRSLASGLTADQVLVLPTTQCHLPQKIIDALTNGEAGISDVADQAWSDDIPAKWRRRNTFDGTSPPCPHYVAQSSPILVEIGETQHTLTYYRPASSAAPTTQFLDIHQETAAKYARELLESLVPDAPLLHHFFSKLAHIHDEGKDTRIWQIYANNTGAKPLAKSEKYADPGTLAGFRHEWESATKEATVAAWNAFESQCPENDRDVLKSLFDHILVTHHGYLRPDLPDQPNWQSAALDPKRLEANLSWLSLQDRLGPWKLAYLEALLKAADTLASMTESTAEENSNES